MFNSASSLLKRIQRDKGSFEIFNLQGWIVELRFTIYGIRSMNVESGIVDGKQQAELFILDVSTRLPLDLW